MGILGGLYGGLFVNCHRRLSHWRNRYVNSWLKKCIEVQVVGFIVHSVGFTASYFCSSWACSPIPSNDHSFYHDATYVIPYIADLYQSNCPSGHYHQIASLYFNDGATALRLLFHLPRLNPSNGQPMFSTDALAIFVFPYIFLQFITFGIAIPSGTPAALLLPCHHHIKYVFPIVTP